VNAAPGGGKFFLGSFEASAQALAAESIALPVRSDAEIEAAIMGLGRERISRHTRSKCPVQCSQA
jgi:putative tryptophan/tyrosine transport system substrate-binding protein